MLKFVTPKTTKYIKIKKGGNFLITENLSTLKIHKLTQEQYDRALASGNIDPNALYLTPDEGIDLSAYATVEQLNNKADSSHNHDNVYYTESEIDSKVFEINTSISNLINTYETKVDAELKLAEAKTYADERIDTHEHSWNDLADKPFYETETTIVTLDEKYLPESIARTIYVDDALVDVVYAEEDNAEITSVPLNADTLGGIPAADYATKAEIKAYVDDAILGGAW